MTTKFKRVLFTILAEFDVADHIDLAGLECDIRNTLINDIREIDFPPDTTVMIEQVANEVDLKKNEIEGVA